MHSKIDAWADAVRAGTEDEAWCCAAFVLAAQLPIVEVAALAEPGVFRVDLASRAIGWLWARASRVDLARDGMPELSQSIIRLMLPAATSSRCGAPARTLMEWTWGATLLLHRRHGETDPAELIAVLRPTIEETLAMRELLMGPILTGILAYVTANVLGKSGEPDWSACVDRARVDAEHIARALRPVIEGI